MQRVLHSVTALLLMSSCATHPAEHVDRLFEAYAGDAVPGAAVRVIRDGEVLLSRCYGMADLEAREPVTSSSNFRLASISKQFTAMSILMLIEQDRLALDTTLPQIFGDFPAYGASITIEHLLQHRSGLLDYEPLVPEDEVRLAIDGPHDQVHDAEILELMKQQEGGYFTPGSEYRYSNTGYAVLAMIVEKLSGGSFADFLKTRIFEPTGMEHTVAFVNGISTVPERAMGYTVGEGGPEFTDQSRHSAVLGDGGIYSSLEDLTLWDAALYRDELISAATKEQMWTPAPKNYGFGWRIDRYRGHVRQHHSGSTCGFRNYLQRFPEERLTVIVLTNRAEPDVDHLGEQVADLFLAGPTR
ncbi:serine hydrolase domain-containing protein [Planctomycetes bacterium Poly30]|uniref:serine hydrolase domain-containing protein n=1 Tax=Saltatorellus ferox TaxID=2528018 RepID=UPI0011A883D4